MSLYLTPINTNLTLSYYSTSALGVTFFCLPSALYPCICNRCDHICHTCCTRPVNSDLSDCNVGDAGGAVGVGAGEGEDFVQFFAEGGGEGAVPYSVDEDEAAAAVLEVLAEDLAEVIQLVLQGGPFGDAFAAGDELAADGADGKAVELQFVVAFAEADDGGLIIGVHHPDLLAHGEAFVPGVFLFPALELHGTPARLILLRFRLRFGLKALLDDTEVFEVGEFQVSSGVS